MITEYYELQEAITRASKPVIVESRTDDGEWIPQSWADEKTAAHYEGIMARRGVQTRRPKAE